jgi:hypothetical protein
LSLFLFFFFLSLTIPCSHIYMTPCCSPLHPVSPLHLASPLVTCHLFHVTPLAFTLVMSPLCHASHLVRCHLFTTHCPSLAYCRL